MDERVTSVKALFLDLAKNVGSITEDEAREIERRSGIELRYNRASPYRGAVTNDMFDSIVRQDWRHRTLAQRAVCRMMSDASTRFLVICSPTGYGKTVAALEFITKHGGVWMKADRIRRGWAQETAEAQVIRRTALTCPNLVVDDPGTERGTLSHALYEVVDARQGGARRTLITTNLTSIEFCARYGERTVDRLRESGRIIDVSGRDMR